MAGSKEDDVEVQTGECLSGQFKKKKKKLHQTLSEDKALTTQSAKLWVQILRTHVKQGTVSCVHDLLLI